MMDGFGLLEHRVEDCMMAWTLGRKERSKWLVMPAKGIGSISSHEAFMTLWSPQGPEESATSTSRAHFNLLPLCPLSPATLASFSSSKTLCSSLCTCIVPSRTLPHPSPTPCWLPPSLQKSLKEASPLFQARPVLHAPEQSLPTQVLLPFVAREFFGVGSTLCIVES